MISLYTLFEKKDYDQYNNYGCGYIWKFIKQYPEYNNREFLDFVGNKNQGDRDSGELQDISKEEILRLAKEYKND